MEYTEEVKKEADSVMVKYMSQFHPVTINNHLSKLIITFAIQDRQSVLEENKSVLEMLFLHAHGRARLPIHERIHSLTQQIDYLKSKI